MSLKVKPGWSDLPKIKDGHPSNRHRVFPVGIDEDGFTEFDTAPVPCGIWYDGGNVYCDDHERLFAEEYPQGWAHYPGDICPHGKYTGGSGRDIMCGACEMGE